MARILIVDDDKEMLALERLLLSGEGHQVLVAESSGIAMELLKVYEVDLIIADIMMPHLNGFQFANLVKNNPDMCKTPLAFLTAKRGPRDVIKAGEIGADFFIAKPIQAQDFVAKVAQFFEKNPPKSRPVVKFERPQQGKAKILTAADVTLISELGVEVITKEELVLDQVLTLSISAFHEIPMRDPLMRVMWTRDDKDGVFRAGLTFVNMAPDVARKLQKWIGSHQLRRAG